MYRRYIKRLLGLLLSIPGLPFFAILFIVVAPIIVLEDHGPVFYNAPRLGKDRKGDCASGRRGCGDYATGSMVARALKAVKILEQKGVYCSVINMHTIKPLDTEAVTCQLL